MDNTAVSVLTDAIGSLKTDLLSIAGLGVGAAATLYAVTAGWRKVRSFVK